MSFLRKFATPLTIFGSFIVLGTGLWMYFFSKNLVLEEVHSQVGLLFVIAVVFHIIVNKASFFRLLSLKNSYLSGLVVLLLAVSVIIYKSGEDNKKIPMGAILHNLEGAKLVNICNAFSLDCNQVQSELLKQGIKVESFEYTMTQIGQQNQMDSKKVLNSTLAFILKK